MDPEMPKEEGPDEQSGPDQEGESLDELLPSAPGPGVEEQMFLPPDDELELLGHEPTELDVLARAFASGEMNDADFARFHELALESPTVVRKAMEIMWFHDVADSLTFHEAMGERFDEATYPDAYREARRIAELYDRDPRSGRPPPEDS